MISKNDIVFANAIGWVRVSDVVLDHLGHLAGVWVMDPDGDPVGVPAHQLWWMPTGSSAPARCSLGLGGTA